MAVINVEGSTSFNPDEDRLYDPNEIIKYCSSLVSVSTAQSHPVYLAKNNVYGYTIGEAIELRLAHFSVKEYLISEHAVYSFRMSDELANISLRGHASPCCFISILLNPNSARIPTTNARQQGMMKPLKRSLEVLKGSL